MPKLDAWKPELERVDEQATIIVTTNLAFGEWPTVFDDA
jgi:hypothetical protein